MFQSPGAIAFNIGPIAVHWYGIAIGLGILACYLYAFFETKRRKLDMKPLDDMAAWVIISGVVGARLYYVLFNLDHFAANPIEIPQLWKGGLAIHGALLGGALAYFACIFRYKLNWLFYADIIMPGILLAQAVGRWGNFFNNEAFGRPASLLWKLYIPEIYRPEGYVDFSYFHPAFLYEFIWNFLGVLLLIVLARKFSGGRPAGLLLCIYLMWYSFGRFFIEGIRLDSLYLGPFRAAQIVSIILFFTGFFGLLFLFKKRKI